MRPLFGSGGAGRDIGTNRRGRLTNRDSFVGIGMSNQLIVSLDTVFCVRDFVLSGIAVYLRFWLSVNPKCCLPCCESDTYEAVTTNPFVSKTALNISTLSPK